ISSSTPLRYINPNINSVASPGCFELNIFAHSSKINSMSETLEMTEYKFGTKAIHAGQEPDPATGAIMTPIYQTSTYVQESPGKHKGYDYSRSINPTRSAYERCIANLEVGTRGWAFAWGLAAMATALDGLDSGSHL